AQKLPRRHLYTKRSPGALTMQTVIAVASDICSLKSTGALLLRMICIHKYDDFAYSGAIARFPSERGCYVVPANRAGFPVVAGRVRCPCRAAHPAAAG